MSQFCSEKEQREGGEGFGDIMKISIEYFMDRSFVVTGAQEKYDFKFTI